MNAFVFFFGKTGERSKIRNQIKLSVSADEAS